MRLSETQLEWLKAKGKFILRLTFRLRTIPLIGLIIYGLIPGNILFSFPYKIRMFFAYSFALLAFGSVPYITNMVTQPMVDLFGFTLFGKKYSKKEFSKPEIKALADRMGLENVKVYFTNSPWVKGPFCNLISREVILPEKWKHPEQEPLATISHEFGHIKHRKQFFIELIIGIIIIVLSTRFIFNHTLPSICGMATLSSEMLLFTKLSWRNEDRADKEGALYAGPEGLISLFEKLKSEAQWDDDSESHRSLEKRIKKLYKILDEMDENPESLTS